MSDDNQRYNPFARKKADQASVISRTVTIPGHIRGILGYLSAFLCPLRRAFYHVNGNDWINKIEIILDVWFIIDFIFRFGNINIFDIIIIKIKKIFFPKRVKSRLEQREIKYKLAGLKLNNNDNNGNLNNESNNLKDFTLGEIVSHICYEFPIQMRKYPKKISLRCGIFPFIISRILKYGSQEEKLQQFAA